MNKTWALFLSGRGSTAQSALELSSETNLRLVVSSKSSAYGLKRARRAGIPTLVLDKKIDWDSLHQILIQRKIDRIFLLGFMKIVPEKFVQLWPKKIFNIHPSLLPDFKGAHGFQESFESPMAWMGVTIHEVTEGMDEGPQRLQKKVLSATEKKKFSMDQAQLWMSIGEQNLIRSFLRGGGP